MILIDGNEQITKNDPASPKTLIGKKAAKKIASAETVKLQVLQSQRYTVAGIHFYETVSRLKQSLLIIGPAAHQLELFCEGFSLTTR